MAPHRRRLRAAPRPGRRGQPARRRDAASYTRPDELHQAFAFAFLAAPWDARGLAEAAVDAARRQRRHRRLDDVGRREPRRRRASPTRYGGGAQGRARARAALLAVLGLPGAAYLYQGQELGLPEVDVPEDRRQDPAWARNGVSRDGCRVPLPWTAESAGGHGFSAEATREPWLPVPDGWGPLSVEAQSGDEASMLALCRRALRIRAQLHRERRGVGR